MDTSSEIVPVESRHSLLSVSLVLAGVPLCSSGLFAGAALSQSLPLAKAASAALVGGLVITIYAGLIGAIGAKKGLTTTLLLKECFGGTGSAMVAIVLAVCLGGWYAVQTGYFGQTINELFPNSGLLTSPQVAALWGGLLMLSTAYFGFKGLKLLSLIAVPLIAGLSIWGLYMATKKVDVWSVTPGGEGSFGDAVTLVVGSFAVGATVNADITRYSKHALHAWIATIAGFFVANVYILVAGAATGLATGSGDLVAAMTVLGLGAPALLVLVLGQWTTNDNNLYWASVNLGSVAPKAKKGHLVVAVGIIATCLGVAGLADYFVPFLIWLGVLIPPIGGVLISHHLIVAQRHTTSERRFSLAAFAAWVTGSVVGAVFDFGAPALNSVVTGFAVYSALALLTKRSSAESTVS